MTIQEILVELIARGVRADVIAEISAVFASKGVGDTVREQTRERVRRYRERQRNPDEQVTLRNGTVTLQSTSKDSPLKEGFLPEESLKKPTLVKGRGGRLPADWLPSSADVEFARGVIAEAWHLERDKFRDYWHGKAGQAANKVDWSATWRNWVRKAAEHRNGNGGGNGGRKTTRQVAEGLAAKLRARETDAFGGGADGGENAFGVSGDHGDLFGGVSGDFGANVVPIPSRGGNGRG